MKTSFYRSHSSFLNTYSISSHREFTIWEMASLSANVKNPLFPIVCFIDWCGLYIYIYIYRYSLGML